MDIPKAKKINKKLTAHGEVRIDPYYWLNERENLEVIQYLEQENAYCDFVMKDTELLQRELFEEMKSRYKEEDESLPYFFNEYWYITRYEKGTEYPVFTRKYQSQENEEELLLDVNILADGHDFYDVGGIAISLNNEIMAYSEDITGRRIYTIHIQNLKTKEKLEEKLENTTGRIVWANDNEHFFYIRKNEHLRAYKIYRHRLGTSQEEDILVFHEEDEAFDVSVFKTKSLEYIFIASSSTVSDEHRFIPAADVFAEWRIVQPREEGLEYAVEHYENDFYILTNEGGDYNFKLVKTSVDTPYKENWVEVIPHRKEVLLEGFEIFKNYLVLEEREKGLLQLNIFDYKNKTSWYLPFNDPTYTAYIGLNWVLDLLR